MNKTNLHEVAILEVRNLSISARKPDQERPSGVLFDGLSFEVKAGQILGVMGPSGCGKSTLLMWMAGLLGRDFIASGQISFGGKDLTSLAAETRQIGLLFQDHLLFPHLSVADNLAFGLPPYVKGKAKRQSRVEAALKSARLDGLGDRDPMSLSGGQQARAALMRTLLADPNILLLDEPFSKLDAELRTDFRAFVFSEATQRNLPTLLVSHDIEDMHELEAPPLLLSNSSN